MLGIACLFLTSCVSKKEAYTPKRAETSAEFESIGYADDVSIEPPRTAEPPPPPPPAMEEIAYEKSTIRIKKGSDALSLESAADMRMEVAEAEMMASEAKQSKIKSGTLTAGEINDFQKWKLWEDIAAEDLNEWQQHWNISPLERYSVQLVSTENSAIVDAEVQLLDGKNVIWQSRSDNTGKAELWTNVFQQKTNKGQLSIVVKYAGEDYPIQQISSFQQGVNMLTIPVACAPQSKQVDIAFVVDATGSMGDEIEYLKVELNDIIERVKNNAPDLAIRLGTLFYRDEGKEAYVTRKSPFSKNISETTKFIKAQSAGGGGDFPEAVDIALEETINSMNWSTNALSRLLFLVLDAPPHHNSKVQERLERVTRKAAAKGIRIIPVTGSGIDKSTEYLMRTFALLTNGSYTFLTNHSGIGNPHIEPTTDTYKVEKLNDLIVRLIHQYTYLPACDKNDLQALNPPTQTEKPSDALNWKYFPNPTSGQLRLEIKGKIEHVYLTDFSGKILQRYSVGENQALDLDISKYPSGIYFLTASDGKESLKGKLILSHQA